MIAMPRRACRLSTVVLIVICLAVAAAVPSPAQEQAAPATAGLRAVVFGEPAGTAKTIVGLALEDGSKVALAAPLPLFSMLVDGRLTTAAALPPGLAFTVTPEAGFKPGAKISVVFRNVGKSKITLENLVPLGQGDDRVYITAREGATKVIALGKEYKELATNQLDDTFDATMALVDDEIFLRGRKNLYCIGAPR